MVLLMLSIPMFASYFFDDIFTTISHIFKNPQILDLGWNLSDYGFYGGAYSLLCVWGGLVICGMLLDKWGIRFTGSLFLGLMVGGSMIAGVAVTRSIAKWFKGKEMALAMGLQLALARLGTATALIIVPRLVKIDQAYIPFSETSKPTVIAMILMMIAIVLWTMFVLTDKTYDKQTAARF